jgi:aspartate/methionine/tyrosine aminotransferase
VETYRLVERARGAGVAERAWELDLDSLRRAVSRRTKIVLVTHPNNPTGHVLSEDEMDAVVGVARKVGAWIVSDEVYRGAELEGGTTPTFFGRYPRVLVTGGLSKAFGLPGLRTGWMVGPPKWVERLQKYPDYLTLTPATLSERLAGLAMQPSRRDWLLERTRRIVRSQWPRLLRWVESHAGLLTPAAPRAGAIAMIRYDLPISGNALFDRLHREKSVLVNPASHFGIPGKYFRVGFGYDIDHISKGLDRISELIAELRSNAKRVGPQRT